MSLAIGAVVASVFLALADGVFHGPLSFKYATADFHVAAFLSMLGTWSYDLRQVADELIFVGIVLFIGAKFFETRTVFSVGFDKLDSAQVSMKGPDENNVVWIGHRYASRLEAETVAAHIEQRLKAG